MRFAVLKLLVKAPAFLATRELSLLPQELAVRVLDPQLFRTSSAQLLPKKRFAGLHLAHRHRPLRGTSNIRRYHRRNQVPACAPLVVAQNRLLRESNRSARIREPRSSSIRPVFLRRCKHTMRCRRPRVPLACLYRENYLGYRCARLRISRIRSQFLPGLPALRVEEQMPRRHPAIWPGNSRFPAEARRSRASLCEGIAQNSAHKFSCSPHTSGPKTKLIHGLVRLSVLRLACHPEALRRQVRECRVLLVQ